MTRPSFGQREARTLAYSQASALKDHADYVRGGVRKRDRSRSSEGRPIDRALAWVSYFTLVFSATVTLTPGSATAAVLTVHSLVTTGLSG